MLDARFWLGNPALSWLRPRTAATARGPHPEPAKRDPVPAPTLPMLKRGKGRPRDTVRAGGALAPSSPSDQSRSNLCKIHRADGPVRSEFCTASDTPAKFSHYP